MSAPSVVSSTFGRAASGVVSNEPKAPLASADPARLAQVCLSTANQLAARGQDAAAIEQFEKAKTFDASIDVTHELAVLYGRAGESARADQLFRSAINDAPRDDRLLSDYGYFLYSAGRLAEAKSTLQDALGLNETPTTQANLACVLVALGQPDKACRLFGTAGSESEAQLSVALLAAHQGDDRTAAEFARRAANDPLTATKARAVAGRIAEREPQSALR